MDFPNLLMNIYNITSRSLMGWFQNVKVSDWITASKFKQKHPHLALVCELWSAYYEYIERNWPRYYNGTAL